MLTDLVSIIRFALDLSPELVPYRELVEQRVDAVLEIADRVAFIENGRKQLPHVRQTLINPKVYRYVR